MFGLQHYNFGRFKYFKVSTTSIKFNEKLNEKNVRYQIKKITKGTVDGTRESLPLGYTYINNNGLRYQFAARY